MQWYVWIVGRWITEQEWGIVGVFTSRDRAWAVAKPGEFVACLPTDVAVVGLATMPAEWKE